MGNDEKSSTLGGSIEKAARRATRPAKVSMKAADLALRMGAPLAPKLRRAAQLRRLEKAEQALRDRGLDMPGAAPRNRNPKR